MENISVQICTKNRAGELYGCLVSLWNQSIDDWDLIIVDSGEDARKWKMINDILMRFKFDGHGVTYLRDDSGKGIGRSRNMAILESKSELCLRADDDSVLDENYLSLLNYYYHKLTNKGEKVGAIGGIVPVLGQPIWRRKALNTFNELIFKDDVEIKDDGGFSYYGVEPIPSHHLRSSFLFSKKAAVEVGLHPENLGMSGFREETDFTVKLRVNGYKLYTVPEALCWHLQAQSGGVRIPPAEYVRQVNENTIWLKKRLLKWHEEGKI